MRRLPQLLAGTALGLFGLVGAAAAQTPGYTLPQANLRAGPGRDYPLISLVPPGQPTQIFGCESGWGWCDVAVDGMRGWVSGRKLQILYHNRRVGLSYYAPRLALPVIQFNIGTYWGQYYQGRPFYAEHNRWDHGQWDQAHWDHGNGHNDYNNPGPPHPPGFQGAPGYGEGHPMPSAEPRPPLGRPDEPGHPMPQPGGPGPGLTRAPDQAAPDHVRPTEMRPEAEPARTGPDTHARPPTAPGPTEHHDAGDHAPAPHPAPGPHPAPTPHPDKNGQVPPPAPPQ
jgi:uncharacterized protein YraI